MTTDTAILAAVLAVTLGLVEALKALIHRRNSSHNRNPFCKYDKVQSTTIITRQEEILRCLGRIEHLLSDRKDE